MLKNKASPNPKMPQVVLGAGAAILITFDVGEH